MLAIQTKVGNAVTELSWDLRSMVNAGKFQFGSNENGIYLLNTGETDDGVQYERSFTLATTDMGKSNPKTCRSIDLGIDTDNPITVSVMADNQEFRTYTVTPRKTGLQRMRADVGTDGLGRYWTVKISSMYPFTIDQIDGTFIVRSLGTRG